jgi:nicotinamide riboside kinase
MKKFVVCFAGVPGSSKTTIINHLSTQFRLPVFSNDQLRYEIKEELMVDDINVPEALERYNKRVKEIRNKILSSGTSFAYDCSVDRKWATLKAELSQYEYGYFLISLDFSKEFMAKMYKATGSLWTIEDLEAYYKQHQDFLTVYGQDASLHLADKDFINRVQICLDAVKKFVNDSVTFKQS